MHFTWISTSYLSYSNLIELLVILAEGLKWKLNGIIYLNLIKRLNIVIDIEYLLTKTKSCSQVDFKGYALSKPTFINVVW